jgi:hypothetical protein
LRRKNPTPKLEIELFVQGLLDHTESSGISKMSRSELPILPVVSRPAGGGLRLVSSNAAAADLEGFLGDLALDVVRIPH